MLKKRILASSLASVMALSSVSVVAFADETATVKYNEAITKPELKELLAEIEKDVDKGVYDEYGTKFGEIFTKAFEAAKLAVEDGSEDYIIASYQVLQSVLAKKQDVDIDALKELVSDLSGKYNKGNIINKELTADYYYEPATWTTFQYAYEEAEFACDSDNKAEICDAYFTLVEADNGLKPTTQITKSQLNKAYQEYREVIEQKFQNESWRRGKATESVTSGRTTGTADFKNETITYGDLFGIIAGGSTAATINGTTVNGTWIALPTGGATLEAAIDAQYATFMGLKSASKTANADIVKAYNACVDAVRVFKGWQIDTVRRGTAASFDALVRSNATTLWTLDLDKDGNADALASASKAPFFNTDVSTASFTIEGTKIYLNNADSSPLAFKLDDNGKMQYDADGKFIVGTTGTDASVDASGKLDVTSMMPEFNNTTIGTAASTYGKYLDGKCKAGGNYGITLTDALQAKANIDGFVAAADTLVKDYSLNFDANAAVTPIADKALTKTYYNDINSITDKSNSAAAYSLAYRILQYALDDIIPAPDAKYKKSDVKAYVAKANVLLEQAEKSATFATQAANLADELAATAEWLAAAGKRDYVEYEGVTYNAVKSTTIVKSGANSTKVWGAIDTAYKALENELAKYPYSYEEISATIAKAAEGIDAGAYGASVADLVEKVAYGLVTLETAEANANNPYDEDTFAFIAYNRVNKDATESQKALVADYNALLKAMEETTADVVKGDADGDGKVTVNDALRALKASVGSVTLSESEKKAADVDGAPGVTALDALTILKMALKIV